MESWRNLNLTIIREMQSTIVLNLLNFHGRTSISKLKQQVSQAHAGKLQNRVCTFSKVYQGLQCLEQQLILWVQVVVAKPAFWICSVIALESSKTWHLQVKSNSMTKYRLTKSHLAKWARMLCKTTFYLNTLQCMRHLLSQQGWDLRFPLKSKTEELMSCWKI
jgi:hypothetical protein